MTLAEIMTQPPITVREDAGVEEVAARMIAHRVGCLPVVAIQGQIVGIVTPCDFGAKEGGCPFPLFCASGLPEAQDGHCSSHGGSMVPGRAPHTAREIMTPRPIVLDEDATVVEAVARMLHLGIDHIPVVRQGIPVGIVARHDLLRLTLHLLSGCRWDAGGTRSKAHAPTPPTVHGKGDPVAGSVQATTTPAARASDASDHIRPQAERTGAP